MLQIKLPTNVAQKSVMLIVDILVNHYGYKCTSCDITSFITDHLPQFIIVKNFKKIRSSTGKAKLNSVILRVLLLTSWKNINNSQREKLNLGQDLLKLNYGYI